MQLEPFPQFWAAQGAALLDSQSICVGEQMKIEQSFQLQQKERIVPDHQQMWHGGREKRDEVDFFCNNETLKIDGGLPFVTEPIVTSYNVPSQGSEKCTMGGEDERELIEKGTFQKGKRQG